MQYSAASLVSGCDFYTGSSHKWFFGPKEAGILYVRKERIAGLKFRTPLAPKLSGGVVVFHIPGIDLSKALDILYHKHSIGCAVFGGDSGGIRLCPHIYNTVEEIDKAVDAVAS